MQRTTTAQLESLIWQLSAVTNAPMVRGGGWRMVCMVCNASGIKVPVTVTQDEVGHWHGDCGTHGREGGFTNVAEPGAWVLDGNIGGYRVERICNDGGGVTCPLGEARHSKGELWHALRAVLSGIREVLGEDEFHKRMRRAYPDQKAA